MLGSKWHRVGQVNDLAVDFLAIAPYQFGKFERKGIFDCCIVNGFRSALDLMEPFRPLIADSAEPWSFTSFTQAGVQS